MLASLHLMWSLSGGMTRERLKEYVTYSVIRRGLMVIMIVSRKVCLWRLIIVGANG